MQGELRALFLEQLYLKCPVPTALAGPDRRLLAVNQAFERLVRAPEAVVTGTDLLELFTPDGHETLREALGRSEEGTPADCDLLALRAGAREIPVSLSSIAVSDDGLPSGYCLTLTDLSARKQEERIHRWFVDEVIRAQEEERRRIARELHDHTGQAVAALIVRLMALLDAVRDREIRSGLSELLVLATDAVDEVRRMARGLRPAALDDGGLKAAVEAQAADFGKSHGIRIDLHVPGLEGAEELDEDLKIAVYRILQEALTNVSRHAAARRVSLVAERRDQRLKLIVEDDGKGFQAPPQPSSREGLGLVGIRERVALLRGTMTIESRPGKGTTLYVDIPLEKQP
jgi:PAS domain S-box-containing protein